MKTSLVPIFVLLTCCGAAAQKITLSGQVSIHNSQYNGKMQFVKDAYASAPFAKSDDTDEAGVFQLEFAGVPAGTSVKVQVEKAGLDVVNATDLQDVVVGRISPIKVFLAEKGQLAQAQAELLDISTKALTARHEGLIARLRKDNKDSQALIAELEQQLGQEIADWQEAEAILNKRLEEARQRLPETARILAAVNLDFASAQYVNAYQLYEKGDIEKALAILDEQDLEKAGTEAATSLEQTSANLEQYKAAREQEQERVGQIVKSYRLKVASYRILFQYKNAANVFEKAVKLLEKTKKAEDMELAEAYGEISSLLRDIGQFMKAKDYQLKQVKICEKLLTPAAPELQEARGNLAATLVDVQEYTEALKVYEQVLATDQELFGTLSCEAGWDYDAIGSVYNKLKNYPAAKTFYYKKQEALASCRGENDPSAIFTSMEIAGAHGALGEYKEAKIVLEKAAALAEKNPEIEHHLLALLYQTLVTVSEGAGDEAAAKTWKNKAMVAADSTDGFLRQLTLMQIGDSIGALNLAENAVLQEDTEDEDASDPLYKAMNYLNLANLKKDGNRQEAIEYFEKARVLYETALDPDDLMSAMTYGMFYMFLMEVEDYSRAKVYIEKSLALNKRSYGEEHTMTLINYENLALVLKKLNELEYAKQCQEKVAFAREKNLGSSHIETARSFRSLGEMLFEQGKLDSAEILVSKALEVFLKAENGEVFHVGTVSLLQKICHKRGLGLLQANQFEPALADLNRALDLVLEFYHLTSGKYIEKALKESGKTFLPFASAEIFNQAGLCYYYLGELSKAVEYYDKSFQANPREQFTHYNNKGMALVQAGNLEEAEKCFRQLTEIAPNNSYVYRNWAIFFSKSGDNSKALDNLEKAVDLGYNNVFFIEMEAAFNPLHAEERYIKLVNGLKNK